MLAGKEKALTTNDPPHDDALLLVDDDPAFTRVMSDGLARRGFEVIVAHGVQEGATHLSDSRIGVLVTDLRMGSGGGLQLCRRAQSQRPDVPVIIATAFGTLDAAVELLRSGAFDLLVKPLEIDRLAHAVERARRHRAMHLELQRLREQTTPSDDAAWLLGRSPAVRELRELVGRVATSAASVMIIGETGTGKELVAKALHRLSGRTGPFIAINCAAIPEALLESELFGHVKGAFTDAVRDRPGLIVRASEGTLFLDEIGEMAPRLQVKLLRALQERRVRPVGADEEIPFNARVVAATNRAIDAAVAEGHLREDLVFRLAVITIEVPPLRDRGQDVLQLADHFLSRSAREHGRPVTTITPQAADRLLSYAWPGNVRELENGIERAVVMARFDALTADDLPARIRDHVAPLGESLATDRVLTLDEVARRYSRHVVEITGGNKSAAARLLGIDRKTLLKRLGPE